MPVSIGQQHGRFCNARAVANEHALGLGFVITEDDPYTCVDFDNCIDHHGQIDEQTRESLDLLSGWVELSPSETGLHIWVKNDQPVSRRVKRLEVYSFLQPYRYLSCEKIRTEGFEEQLDSL